MITNEQSISKQRRPLQDILSLLFAIATAGSVTMISFTSFTAFNSPDWLRIARMAPLLFLISLSVGFGVIDSKRDFGRVWAIGALVITVLSLIAFIIMLNVGG